MENLSESKHPWFLGTGVPTNLTGLAELVCKREMEKLGKLGELVRRAGSGGHLADVVDFDSSRTSQARRALVGARFLEHFGARVASLCWTPETSSPDPSHDLPTVARPPSECMRLPPHSTPPLYSQQLHDNE